MVSARTTENLEADEAPLKHLGSTEIDRLLEPEVLTFKQPLLPQPPVSQSGMTTNNHSTTATTQNKQAIALTRTATSSTNSTTNTTPEASDDEKDKVEKLMVGDSKDPVKSKEDDRRPTLWRPRSKREMLMSRNASANPGASLWQPRGV